MKDFDIPIFKKTYDFYKDFYKALQQFPRKDRYSLGQRCEESLLFVLELFWLSSTSKDKKKLKHLKKANAKINMIRIYLRLAKDIQALDKKRYTRLQEKINEIGKMLGGWIKATKGK